MPRDTAACMWGTHARLHSRVCIALLTLFLLPFHPRGSNADERIPRSQLFRPKLPLGSRCVGILPCPESGPLGIHARVLGSVSLRSDGTVLGGWIEPGADVALLGWGTLGASFPIDIAPGLQGTPQPVRLYGKVAFLPPSLRFSGAAYAIAELPAGPFAASDDRGTPASRTLETGVTVADKLGWILHWTVAGGVRLGGPTQQIHMGAGIEVRAESLRLLAQLLYQAPLGCRADARVLCNPTLVFAGTLSVPWDVYGHDSLMFGVTRGSPQTSGYFVAATLGVGYDADVRDRHGDGITAAEQGWILARDRLRQWHQTWFSSEQVLETGADAQVLTAWLAWQRAQAQAGLPPRLWDDEPLSQSAPAIGWQRVADVRHLLVTDETAVSSARSSKPGSLAARLVRRNRSGPRLSLAGLVAVPDEGGMPQLVPMYRAEQARELGRTLEALREYDAQDRARREQALRVAEALRPLPDMGQVVANTMLEAPLALLGPFLMWDEESARNVVELTRRVRVFKYGPDAQEAGEGMQLGLFALAGLAPGLALGAERAAGMAGAQVMVRAVERQAAQATVRTAARGQIALAQQAEAGLRLEPQAARSLLVRLARKPADWLDRLSYRVELRGLGSNFGNVRVRRIDPRSGEALAESLHDARPIEKAVEKIDDQGLKAAHLADGAAESADAAQPGSRAPDFIVTPTGTAVPTSQRRMLSGFERAGFPRAPTVKDEPGRIYSVPTPHGTIDVRTMEGSQHHPRRAVFSRKGTSDPVKVDGEKFRGNVPQLTRRAESHLVQEE